jgi:hypothetical protein
MKLTFDKGTIQIKGYIRVPNSIWDDRSKTFRAMALYYRDTIDFLKASGFDFEDDVLNLLPCPELQSSVVLRDYQNQALDVWIANGNRGIIVLAARRTASIVQMPAKSGSYDVADHGCAGGQTASRAAALIGPTRQAWGFMGQRTRRRCWPEVKAGRCDGNALRDLAASWPAPPQDYWRHRVPSSVVRLLGTDCYLFLRAAQ